MAAVREGTPHDVARAVSAQFATKRVLHPLVHMALGECLEHRRTEHARALLTSCFAHSTASLETAVHAVVWTENEELLELLLQMGASAEMAFSSAITAGSERLAMICLALCDTDAILACLNNITRPLILWRNNIFYEALVARLSSPQAFELAVKLMSPRPLAQVLTGSADKTDPDSWDSTARTRARHVFVSVPAFDTSQLALSARLVRDEGDIVCCTRMLRVVAQELLHGPNMQPLAIFALENNFVELARLTLACDAPLPRVATPRFSRTPSLAMYELLMDCAKPQLLFVVAAAGGHMTHVRALLSLLRSRIAPLTFMNAAWNAAVKLGQYRVMKRLAPVLRGRELAWPSRLLKVPDGARAVRLLARLRSRERERNSRLDPVVCGAVGFSSALMAVRCGLIVPDMRTNHGAFIHLFTGKNPTLHALPSISASVTAMLCRAAPFEPQLYSPRLPALPPILRRR